MLPHATRLFRRGLDCTFFFVNEPLIFYHGNNVNRGVGVPLVFYHVSGANLSLTSKNISTASRNAIFVHHTHFSLRSLDDSTCGSLVTIIQFIYYRVGNFNSELLSNLRISSTTNLASAGFIILASLFRIGYLAKNRSPKSAIPMNPNAPGVGYNFLIRGSCLY